MRSNKFKGFMAEIKSVVQDTSHQCGKYCFPRTEFYILFLKCERGSIIYPVEPTMQVELMGYDDRYLVYEYIPNGYLNDHLHDPFMKAN